MIFTVGKKIAMYKNSRRATPSTFSGGTGFSPRDVTPEATRAVIEREAPGIAYAMITRSMAVTEMAMLSRAVAGIASETLVVNLPGSAKAAVECFGFIKASILHAVALITDNKELVENVHKWVQQEERKPSATEANPSPSKVRKEEEEK